MPGAFAQPQTDQQDHSAHHPPGAAPAQPAAPPAAGQGGAMGNQAQGEMMNGCPMMGGQGGMMGQQSGPSDMRPMMPMMQSMMAMMSAQTGMMAPHAESRIAALKTQLKITEAQAPQWTRFADALRATAKSMNEMHQPMMQPGKAGKPLPDQLAAREQAMSAHVASPKTVREALQPLYASFSDEQKKIADGLMIGPMGMM